jgi:hypothetical protein
LPGKLTFYGSVLESLACVRKAAGEIIITIFLILRRKENKNELVVTSNKLTNKFEDLVRSGLGSDVARGPPA